MHIHFQEGLGAWLSVLAPRKIIHYPFITRLLSPGRGRGWRGCSSAQGGQGRVGAAAHLRVAPLA